MPAIEDRLKELNIKLPQSPKPVAAYIPAMQIGNLVMTSGQLPLVEGQLQHVGKAGSRSLSTEMAAEQARAACLNALAAIKELIGDLDRIQQIVRLVVYVQCDEKYHAQPQVANGASSLLTDIFGEKGKHIRSAVGTNSLPLNSPVELELTVQVS